MKEVKVENLNFANNKDVKIVLEEEENIKKTIIMVGDHVVVEVA